MRYRIFIFLGCALLSACATAPQPLAKDIEPAAAVTAAASKPVSGTFRLFVRSAERRAGFLYLYSAQNSTDPHGLTIVIPDAVNTELAKTLDGEPEVFLKGRTIRVTGEAHRAADSSTQVTVFHAGQLQVL